MAATEQSTMDVKRVAVISNNIREALRKAMPAPAEQFLTVSVPGKVVKFDDFLGGTDPVTGKINSVLPPIAVRLEEARLVDDMPAMSSVALGPTGRSVARSYELALSKLVPVGTTVGADAPDKDPLQERYTKAMNYLNGPHHSGGNKTRIQVYTEKQKEYTRACEEKTAAFEKAREIAEKDPANPSVASQIEAYNRWVAKNAKTYRNRMQAAYMDWVATGKKEEVEFWFAVIDNSSALGRVELSKEAMRASVIQGDEGAVEYNSVNLTPRHWAWLAKKKAEEGDIHIAENKETAQSLTYRIARLKKINLLLQAAIQKFGQPGKKPTENGSDDSVASSGHKTSTSTSPIKDDDPVIRFLETAKELDLLLNITDDKKTEDDRKKIVAKQTELNGYRKTLNENFEGLEKEGFASLSNTASKQREVLFKDGAKALVTLVDANEIKIQSYEDMIATLSDKDSAAAFQDTLTLAAGISADLPPVTPTQVDAVYGSENYWTSIALEIFSTLAKVETESQMTNEHFSRGMSDLYGNSSYLGVSSGHQSQKAFAQLANSHVNVTFECLRVDIQRPWLRSEIFYDRDLDVAPNQRISPGHANLAALLDPINYPNGDAAKKYKLMEWEEFPMFPTAFVLAANLVLDIQGDTTEIQELFSTSQTAASCDLRYGPFRLMQNYSHNSANMQASCEATSFGCRIRVKSPQIIGWMSELLPALPRLGSMPHPMIGATTVTATVPA